MPESDPVMVPRAWLVELREKIGKLADAAEHAAGSHALDILKTSDPEQAKVCRDRALLSLGNVNAYKEAAALLTSALRNQQR